MKVYMAAVYTNNYMPGMKLHERLTDSEKQIMVNIPHVLESYHYVHSQRYVDAMRENGAKVFLDSGAFSAHTLGVNLDLAVYCDYINRNRDIILVEDGALMASVLDGIGDPLKTYQNQMAMESLGVRPLPCFHVGEDERYLEWYVANYDYITLGGMVPVSTKQVTIWLDRIWERYLTDGAGRPRLKVHGFGLTSVPLMKRYPWFSCDSSSWIQMTSFGSVMDPVHGPISVSDKSPSRHTAGQHITNMAAPERAYLEERLRSNGFDPERLATEYPSRAACNVWGFCEINKIMNETGVKAYKGVIQELF